MGGANLEGLQDHREGHGVSRKEEGVPVVRQKNRRGEQELVRLSSRLNGWKRKGKLVFVKLEPLAPQPADHKEESV